MIRKWYADGGNYKKRFDYDLNEESVALDVGGYQGQWASDLFSRYRCNIYVFEPVSDFAERIRKRFLHNDKIKIFPFGLGGSSRTETIYISKESSSIYGTNTNCEQIMVFDVKDWISDHGIDNITLIKINIEGGEYELLDRLIETKLVEKIDNIQVQFHNISKESRIQMERIQQELRKTHKPTYQYEFVWENWTRKSN
jgi:FkbM family methyltransferase